MAMLGLTRRPCPRMADGELTHLTRVPIDMSLAERQHAAYRAALVSAGATAIDLPCLESFPDCAFVEDTVVALPELFVLCRPGAASRRGEVDSVAASLPIDRPVAAISAPGTVDGGDVLTIGRTIYVGRSSRTDAAGIAALAALVQPFGYRVEAVPVSGALHLRTAVTALSGDRVLINPAWVDPAIFAALHPIANDPSEPFGANCLAVGERIILQRSAPATAARVAAAGLAAEFLDISEFAKAEAGLTCLSVLIPPAA